MHAFSEKVVLNEQVCAAYSLIFSVFAIKFCAFFALCRAKNRVIALVEQLNIHNEEDLCCCCGLQIRCDW
nr:MAG TPA: hypothetical protein [Bacteriophage sp.]